ncbi:MAG: ABC transporter ATP-binding protein [Spirochaetales bacterium]|jgi:lipoprotein-releasing system ATP-binding protein|nr:ABC transporter ATP-binding protein [Spirochaetales bacterium]
MNDYIVELQKVTKKYTIGPEDLIILQGLDFFVIQGTTTAILGESGSGKSTLLNLIGGLDRPDTGTICIDGMDISKMDEAELTSFRADSVGFIFQFHYLLNDFNALENVMLPRYMSGTAKGEATEQAEKLLIQANLKDRLHHYPHQLSGGERQRVAVARALINDPAVILADEPTGNLDERNSSAVEEMIFSLAENFGKTLVIVTHDSGFAERSDDRYLLHEGVLEKR